MFNSFETFVYFLHQPLSALRMEYLKIIMEILCNTSTEQALCSLLT